jgi:flagellum-specific ATP synthase
MGEPIDGAVGARAIALSIPQLAAAGACSPLGGRSIAACASSIPSSPGAAASAWASSPGVSKSVLLSMLACNVAADVSVIGLVGSRQEFLQDDLGGSGLACSVIVVSTSDEPTLVRRQAACLTLTIVEFFRDLHKDVLVLINSVTRFAMAQREIGLSAGTITRIFSVLVDGDDHNGSMAHAVRGILTS